MDERRHRTGETRLAVVSDLHISTSSTDEAAERRTRFMETVEAVNARRPHLVLLPGDLTENGLPEELATFRRGLADFEAPAFVVPGNHDVGDKRLPGRPGVTPERIAAYEAAMGPAAFSCAASGVRVIGLNASLLGSGLDQEGEQWRWLEAELSRPADAPICLLLHYPPFRQVHDEPAGDYWTLEPGPRRRLLELAVNGRVAVIISGHLHCPIQTEHEGIRLLTAPSVAFGLPFGVLPSGWMMVTISPTGRVAWELVCAEQPTSSVRGRTSY